MPKKGESLSAEARARVSAAVKKRYADPEERKRASEMQRKLWEDPAIRERRREGMRRHMADPASRERRSEAQIANFRSLATKRVAEPQSKRCSRCRETKPMAAFYTVKRKLKSGLISVRPMAHCKECQKAAVKARRDRRIAEGVDVAAYERALAERNMRKSKAREAKRAYQREWAAAKRRSEGKSSGRYRVRPKQGYTYLPIGPIATFLEERKESPTEMARTSGVSERAIRRLRDREEPRARLETVDAILSGLGCPEEMHLLYPDTSVGYHLLTPDGEKVTPQTDLETAD